MQRGLSAIAELLIIFINNYSIIKFSNATLTITILLGLPPATLLKTTLTTTLCYNSCNKHLDCQLYTADICARIGHQLIQGRG